VILSRDESMALRMGKRRDPQPAILTVNVQQSVNSGVTFQQAGDLLFTADKVPEGCFTGPPLPKEKPEKQKAREPADTGNRRLAGSYMMDLDAQGPKGKKEKPDSWKRDKKRIRREKQKKWPT
jgi:putative RNA 2'-phosphotransferase